VGIGNRVVMFWGEEVDGLDPALMERLGYKKTVYGWQWDKDALVNQEVIMFEGLILKSVHSWEQCQAGTNPTGKHPLKRRPCVIHAPTPHHMRSWYLHWRDDRGIFERICEHGTGHPDPDQLDYWKSIGKEAESIHGCCGCCILTKENLVADKPSLTPKPGSKPVERDPHPPGKKNDKKTR
jgi:hypothetical protein